MVDERRTTPRTDDVLNDAALQAAVARLGRVIVKEAVRHSLEECRQGHIDPSDVAERAHQLLPATASSQHAVINASGVLVHTNLGRAPLSSAAREALQVAAGTTDVELDLSTGRRGRRGQGALRALGEAVPGAEAVHVVNNGAAALVLAALALAGSGSIIIARGELVEIGDGFRLPELLAATGVTLREVGTTNRVTLSDYEAALEETTGFVLKVHPANFRITGFTSSVSVAELATLPVPVVADIGSGLLEAHPRLPAEPTAAQALREGAGLVIASGDKLLGGPQCGLVLGTEGHVHTLRRHPVARAMRVDKLTLGALEATLRGGPSPVAAGLARSTADLMQRAEQVVDQLADLVAASAVASSGAVGGGGAPGVELPSAAVALPEELTEPLRSGDPPVLGRTHQSQLLLDLLAVAPEHDAELVAAVRQVLQSR